MIIESYHRTYSTWYHAIVGSNDLGELVYLLDQEVAHVPIADTESRDQTCIRRHGL